MNLIKELGSFTFKAGFPKDQDFIDSATKVSIARENVGHIGKMIKEIDTIEVNLAKIRTFYTAIQEIENVVKAAGSIKEVKPFLGGGGTITVNHRLADSIKVDVTVQIDSQQLSQRILEAKPVNKGKYTGKKVQEKDATAK